jgi:leucyl/phenylalanyl-tRNA--protein transferase
MVQCRPAGVVVESAETHDALSRKIQGAEELPKSAGCTAIHHHHRRTDEAFEEVIKQCGTVPRPGQDGTWITDEIIQAYVHLHHLGFAHSVECWQGNALVGGLYGVSLGRAFFGESMFSKVSEASKVAFHHLHQLSIEKEFHFIDCQLYTDHLASLGAYEIPREQYLRELRKALDFPDLIGPWKHD